MTGINQGVPETAIGEPIRLGDSNEFEIEQHPVSDRLIIRDTVNGKVAYVREERGGQIGGDGVLVKALKEGKPMADDGRTYDTIQQAERAASSWVFIPPGTFNESVNISTDGLTLKGCGESSLIHNTAVSDSESANCINLYADNVTIDSIGIESDDRFGVINGETVSGITFLNVIINFTLSTSIQLDSQSEIVIVGCRFNGGSGRAVQVGDNSIISNCTVNGYNPNGLFAKGDNVIIANNIVSDCTENNIITDQDNTIIIGNRSINAGQVGVRINGSNDVIVANNRISGSGNNDILDNATNTLLDANLTGASN